MHYLLHVYCINPHHCHIIATPTVLFLGLQAHHALLTAKDFSA